MVDEQSHGRTARASRGAVILVGLALVVAVAAVFGNALQNGFVFDDHLLIVNNRAIRAPLSEFASHNLYRPLRMLSYRLDYAIGGMHPWIFHLNNIVYHAGTVLLVCTALRMMGLSLAGAAAGALIFAVHPVQTDSVTYAAGRRDVLCGLFFIAGFLAYLVYRERRSWAALLAVAACYAAAILTKEMGVTLPLVCLIADRWQTRRAALGIDQTRSDTLTSPTRGVSRRPVFWVTLLLVVIGIAAWAAAYGPFFMRFLGRMHWHGGSVGTNFATVARIWAHYLELVVWPANLSADYSYRAFEISPSLLDPRAVASAALIVVLAVVAVRSWRRGGIFGFAAAWWAATLVPVSHIIPYSELLAEHYLYIPMVGVAFAIAGAVDGALARAPQRRGAIAAVVLVIATAAGVRSVVRNRDWHDTLSLWTATVATVPNCSRARFNLGQAYFERVRFDDAESEWLAAAEIKPGDPGNARALATLYYRLGKYDLAQQHVDHALKLVPGDPHAEILAGWIAVDRGDPQRALAYFDSALARLPEREAKGAMVGKARAEKALNPTPQTWQRIKPKQSDGP